MFVTLWRNRSSLCLASVGMLALALSNVGCSSEPSSQATSSTQTKAETAPDSGSGPPVQGAVTADGVLDAMAQAYRQAERYADAGKVEVHAAINGEKQDESLPFSVTFERPNKLRLHVYQGNLLSDGQELRGWIDTRPGEPFHGQVLAQDAPSQFTLEEVYKDEILVRALTQGIAGSALQLLLLLDKDPLEEIKDGAERAVLLEPQSIDNHLCHRVLLARNDGKLVLWVDQKTSTLRRVEVPVEGLKQHLSKQSGVTAVNDVSVRMELTGAQLGGKIDATAFHLTTPAGAKLVTEFDTRDLLPPPPPQLGKPAPGFSITKLDGNKLEKEALMGRITVLDFWFTTCPPCKLSLPNLEKVYQKYKDNDLVRFVAVSVDEESVKDDALTSMFDELKINVPIARDPVGKLSQSLGLTAFPTLVVIGADGVVEDFEMGYNPQLATSLPAKLDRLLAGESIYKEVLKAYREPMTEAASTTAEPAGAEVPMVEIAAKSEPKNLKLEKLWSNGELQQPGNILVQSSKNGPPRLLVNTGWKQVTELDSAGKVLAQHKLDIPEEDVVAALRTTVDDQGNRRYLGLASSQRQIHLFDDQWKKLLSYPPERDHAGVADAQLADLDGDGLSELLVSYWGVVGVQGVSLQGQRLWANRSLEHVFRMAVTGPDASGHRSVLCSHSQGTLVPLSHTGVAGPPIAIGSNFIRSIHAADLNGDGQMELLGIASSAAGQDTAVGFNLAGEEQWSHPLPRGVQKHPIEMVVSGKLLGNEESQWIVAGPDGSVHVLSIDGEVIEQFNYGAALSGVAILEIEGKPTLLVSTATGLDAWTVRQ